MKKLSIWMIALVAGFVGVQAYANDIAAQEQADTLSSEEKLFTEQLSETHKALFSALSPEQKAAVMATSVEPDQAIEQFIQDLADEHVVR